jgi:hypothetical protein
VTRFAALTLIFVAFGATASADETAPVASAREMFDLFGIDESLFEIFVHGEPMSEAELEPLAKTLFRLPEIKPVNIDRWTNRNVNWQTLIDKPSSFQREFIRLEGNVQSVSVEEPVAEIQEKWGLDNYYRCELILTGGQPATVYARQIPESWKAPRTPLPARSSADAVFLKLGPPEDNDQNSLFFAANRIAWRPPTLLGDLGMDYGLFDEIDDRSVITSAEREAFFQMLAAAGKANSNQLSPAHRAGTVDFVELMERPERHRGEPFSFRGVARRAIRIQVTDPDTVERFGFDHYFEVTIFFDLGGYLTLADRKVSTYPIVFCVRELPDDMPLGENISEAVTATGFMFKQWAYTTGITSPGGKDASMNSPLLIGRTVAWSPPVRDRGFTFGPVAAVLLIAAIAACALVGWHFRRKQKRLRAQLHAKTRQLLPGQSLNHLETSDALTPRSRTQD